MTEEEREAAIGELWREAKNEMWLVRHKRTEKINEIKPRVSFQQKPGLIDNTQRDATKMTHELALGPDVTWEGKER